MPVWNGACHRSARHVRVAPDGTVYLPEQLPWSVGVGVSTYAGKTWTIRKVPGSVNAQTTRRSPQVPMHRVPRVGRRHRSPMVAISQNRGATWKVVNIGTASNVRNTEFAEVIAGDGNRAAFAFLGT